MLLRGLNVIEITSGGAAAWAAKDLADWGANVVSFEPSSGSPLREAPPYYLHDGKRRSATWEWLVRGKTVVQVGPRLATTPAEALAACCEADLVIAEHELLGEMLEIGPEEFRAALEGLTTVVRIAAFAPDGPYSNYRATDLGINSLGGWAGMLGAPDRYPLRPAGDLNPRVTGLHALVAALIALRHHERGSRPSFVELSAQAVAASILTAPWLAYSMLGNESSRRAANWPQSSVPCKDGYAGILPLTHQHWTSLCEVIGIADVLDEPGGRELSYRQQHGAELWERVRSWYESRTREQIYMAGQAARIPSGPMDTVSQRLQDPQLNARGFFENATIDDVTLRVPRVPYLIEDVPPISRSASSETARANLAPRNHESVAAPAPALPLEGLRVIDLTWFWSGPHATMHLGAFGADVIKVESVSRPDSYRFTGGLTSDVDRWWERAYLWNDSNQNKRGITLDLTSETGRALFERLLQSGDVVVSNFSNRVLPNLGYDAEGLHAVNPQLIVVTMPGYGLGGPWGDFVGFGSTFEQAVVGSMNGYSDDGQPRLIGGACDPIVGMTVVAAVELALRRREQAGIGVTVEVPQCEVLDAMFAPEHIAVQHGTPDPGLRGNKHEWMAPHEIYRVSGDDAWVSIAVGSDVEFAALTKVIERQELATDVRFATAEARKKNESVLDQAIEEAIRERDPLELEQALQEAGVAGCHVVPPHLLTEDPGLQHLNYFKPLTRSLTGTHLYKTFPFRFSGFELVHRNAAPMLGQHNRDVLLELCGLSDSEIDALEVAGEIGNKPAHEPV